MLTLKKKQNAREVCRSMLGIYTWLNIIGVISGSTLVGPVEKEIIHRPAVNQSFRYYNNNNKKEARPMHDGTHFQLTTCLNSKLLKCIEIHPLIPSILFYRPQFSPFSQFHPMSFLFTQIALVNPDHNSQLFCK